MKKECNTVSFKNQVIYVGIDIHKYLPSHPHARSQESKIFGRVFLPLNASGRIFRL